MLQAALVMQTALQRASLQALEGLSLGLRQQGMALRTGPQSAS